jgi:RNA polymerase sigma factor (sigma-70 family)
MATRSLQAVAGHIRKIAGAHALHEQCDAQLLSRFIKRRDEAAFTVLIERHGPMVRDLCRRLLSQEPDVDDVFQATFLVLLRKAHSIRKRSSLASWLYGVAYRIARKGNGNAKSKVSAQGRHATQPNDDPSTEAALRELWAVLDDELNKLSEAYRPAFVLCYLQGLTGDEAARQLGWSVRTLKRRLARGRELLQVRLSRRGITLSAALLATGLASTALPSALLSAALNAGYSALAGESAPASGGSAKATALANSLLKAMALAQMKLAMVLALFATTVVAGAGLLAQHVLASRESPPKETRPTSPPQENEPPRLVEDKEPRLDKFGDPLPADAVTRLGTSRFWTGANYEQLKVLFTPDGSRILSATWSGLLVFDANTGRHLYHIKRSISSMSVSPDGKSLALATEGWGKNPRSGIQIRDLMSGRLLQEFKDTGHHKNVVLSPDGKMLASNSYPSLTSRILHLWDPATGREIRRWPLTGVFSNGVAFAPNSKTLIAGDHRSIHFWNVATGREERRIDGHAGYCIYDLALSNDGRILATQAVSKEPKPEAYYLDNTVHLWDTATGKNIHQIKVAPSHGSPCEHFRFSPDSKSLATTSGDDGIVHIWDVATGKELRSWDASSWVGTFAFSPDGKKLAAFAGGNVVRLWDAMTGQELRKHPSHRSAFGALALAPDGRTLASASEDRDVRLWDTATGQQKAALSAIDVYVKALDFSADGRKLTTLGYDGKARVWDVATGKELQHFPLPIKGRLGEHAISPDGKTWASTCVDVGDVPSIVLWDAATGRKRDALVGHEWWTRALSFSPDSGTLYSWNRNGTEQTVRLWDVATHKKTREFDAGEKDIYRGAFSPDGNWFAGVGREDVLLLYDVITGKIARRVNVPAMVHGNRTLAFSADSRVVALGDDEGTAYLLEVASGKCRRRLIGGHKGNISALLFSPDGGRLISGSIDTTAIAWDLTGRLNANLRPLGAAELDACWAELASDNAEQAYQSICRLAKSPKEAVSYLGERLRPIERVDAERVGRLIADLDSARFAVRDAAEKELEKLGEKAAAACRSALTGNPSLELRRRLERLLEKQEQGRVTPSLGRLRVLRALEALELAGTPDARRLLQKLADGDSEARITREAKAAFERLQKRAVKSP